MKYLKNTILSVGYLLCLTLGITQLAFAAPSFTIAVLTDCSAPSGDKVFPHIKKEVLSLTKGEFDVRFPDKYRIELGCSLDRIKQTIDGLLMDPDVDMILTLDPMGSQVLGRYGVLKKPCIAGNIFIPELQGIPLKDGKSGVSNLAYVAMTPEIVKNINQLKEVVSFKKAAVLLDETVLKSFPQSRSHIKKIGSRTGVDFFPLSVGGRVDEIIEKLNHSYDAVLIDHLGQLDDTAHEKLIAHINRMKLPSFSLHQRRWIERGLLAGFDRTEEMNRFARRIAIWTQQILLKENPETFKVGFSRQEKLVINMKTARQLNISPSFALMAKAELIHQDSLLTSPLPTEQSDDGGIALSSLVTDQSQKLSLTALGLNETQASLSLVQAVNRALDNNQLLKSRAKETAAGKMNVKEAVSKFYPQLGAGLGYTVVDPDHTSAISGIAERSWDISARVSQLLYSDTALTHLKTSRRIQTIQELSERQETLDIILNTATAYLNMLKARASAVIQMDNLHLVRSNLVLANNRYKAGFSGPSDVYRLESEAAMAYSNVLDSLAVVSKARIRLNQILNLDLEDNTTIRDISLEDDTFIVGNPDLRAIFKINNPRTFRKFRDFVVTKGLEASPEIKAIDEQMAIQKEAYQLAQRSYWSPTVLLNGSAGKTISKSGEGSTLDSSAPGALSALFSEPDNTRWTLGVTLDLPFYEGGAKSAQRIRALETEQQLKFLKYDTQNKISENIRSALFDLSASHPAIDLARLSAASAKKNLELVQDAYAKGAASIVNFLDAQNAALLANTRAENAVYDFLIDFIISERAAGQYTILMSRDEKQQWIREFNN